MRIKKPLMLAFPALCLYLEPARSCAQNLVISDNYNNCILVYAISNGALLETITDTNPVGKQGIATDIGGNIYVANTTSATSGTVSKYGPDFCLINANFISASNYAPYLMAIDAEGHVFVSDMFGVNGVRKYDPSGFPVIVRGAGQVVTNSDGDNKLASGPNWGFAGGDGLACGLDGCLYTARSTGLISEYRAGQPAIRFLINSGELSGKCVAADSAGNVYVLQANYPSNYVYKCDLNGNVISSIPVPFYTSYGIAVDNRGNVYLGLNADEAAGAGAGYGVNEYDAKGNFLRNFPVTGSNPFFAIQTLPQVNVAAAGISRLMPAE